MQNNKPHIFVIGNEKGGAGKTTCAMHLITGLLYYDYKVASIDADHRQASLSHYLNNRDIYNKNNPDKPVPSPLHYRLKEGDSADFSIKEQQERELFEGIIRELKDVDYIVIDTPGSYNFLSRLAHAFASTVITPINDSFIDLNVMCNVNESDLSIISPSIYSQMVWEQKIQKASRSGETMNWIVMRNRLSNLDSNNKRKITKVLDSLSKRIAFQIAPGFSERVIFRELFLQGLTLLDITKANYDGVFSSSHLGARQELRHFFDFIGIKARSPLN